MSDPKTPLRDREGDRPKPSGRLTAGLRAHGTGRLTSPGQLLAGDVGVAAPDAEGLALAEYALRHGLRPSAQRPTIWNYIAQLWRRRIS